MFTGLIQGRARVALFSQSGSGARLTIESQKNWKNDFDDAKLGDSIAINGVCLTLSNIEKGSKRYSFDIMPETLSLTNLSTLTAGREVNFEKALRFGDYLGGHLVSGDIDGRARVLAHERRGNSLIVRLEPENLNLLKFMILRGRIAVDGASLTIMEWSPRHFAVSLIPLTQEIIGLGKQGIGQICNIETDMLARHIIHAHEFVELVDA